MLLYFYRHFKPTTFHSVIHVHLTSYRFVFQFFISLFLWSMLAYLVSPLHALCMHQCSSRQHSGLPSRFIVQLFAIVGLSIRCSSFYGNTKNDVESPFSHAPVNKLCMAYICNSFPCMYMQLSRACLKAYPITV
jgi:hypothetical protein